jgi:N-acetyllactosaminide beta-1,3-N-acetylglucosaminyltransferase
LALRLYSITDRVHLYPIGDVYIGMCLQKLGLVPEKHKGFRTFDMEEKIRNNICSCVDLM